jgi:transposase
MQCFLGVDVSKAKLDVALLSSKDKFKSKVFANDRVGFAALLQWLQVQVPDLHTNVHICMEASGIYHEAFACFVNEQCLVVSVVNPLLVKRFAEASRLRNKTDGGDAKCIAQFCKSHQSERWEAPSMALRELQALVLTVDPSSALMHWL